MAEIDYRIVRPDVKLDRAARFLVKLMPVGPVILPRRAVFFVNNYVASYDLSVLKSSTIEKSRISRASMLLIE